jgi:hypothetical protein
VQKPFRTLLDVIAIGIGFFYCRAPRPLRVHYAG